MTAELDNAVTNFADNSTEAKHQLNMLRYQRAMLWRGLSAMIQRANIKDPDGPQLAECRKILDEVENPK